MCITEERSFVYNGQRYETELPAVKAALHDVGQRLLKDWPHDMVAGLVAHGKDVTYLRDRYLALTGSPAPEVTSEKGTGEPMGGDRG